MSDLISRQAAIDEIDEWIKAFLENGHNESAADARLIQDGIIQLPSAQKKGEWIPQDYNEKTGYITTAVYYHPKCSECGYSGDYGMNFCPNCGADMRGNSND